MHIRLEGSGSNQEQCCLEAFICREPPSTPGARCKRAQDGLLLLCKSLYENANYVKASVEELTNYSPNYSPWAGPAARNARCGQRTATEQQQQTCSRLGFGVLISSPAVVAMVLSARRRKGRDSRCGQCQQLAPSCMSSKRAAKLRCQVANTTARQLISALSGCPPWRQRQLEAHAP